MIIYAILQVLHWPLFPKHFDIYYHLQTAWGFIQAGGYSGWDFWQYAPIGRPHIYPPLFHIVLAVLMKAGIDKIILAKFFCEVIPVAFLFTLWKFLKKNYSSCLAFFSLITVGSSFSFYSSLSSRLPSTIAMIFGILAVGQFMNKKNITASALLALAFYTHIGSAYLFAIALFIYVLFDKENRRQGIIVVMAAAILAMPIMLRQLAAVNFLSSPYVKENYFCEFKTIEYILAAIGFVILTRSKGRGRFFIAFFLASVIFIRYPARFFGAEGYLPVALLAAVALYGISESFVKNRISKYAVMLFTVFMLIISPTIAMGSHNIGQPSFRLLFFDSAIMNMLFPASDGRMESASLWFDKEYSSASRIIRENSSEDDIIYCADDVIGVCLAVASGRATANGILPEVSPKEAFDPYIGSKIIIMLKYNDPESVKVIAKKYRLVLIGKSGIFDIYMNPFATAKVKIR